jgi:hypothetical protein
MARKKSTGKSTEKKKPAVGELVPQPHGGALRYGGTNAGGTGRPSSAIRERLRGSFDERIQVLEEIADGKAFIPLVYRCPECGFEPESVDPAEVVKSAPQIADRLRSIDIMGKYSLDDRKEIKEEIVREKLRQTLAEIHATLPSEQADALIDRIEPIWQ